jgi:hypothetical protein
VVPYYSTPWVSPPPIKLAKKAATLAIKLPFNTERHLPSRTKTSGSGKPRYGLPDAPLDSCPLVSANPACPAKTGIPFPFSPFLLKGRYS